MSAIPDPTSYRFSLNNRIFSHCAFYVSVSVLMSALDFGSYRLLAFIVELVNSGQQLEAVSLMAAALFVAVTFGALAGRIARVCVEGIEALIAKAFSLFHAQTY